MTAAELVSMLERHVADEAQVHLETDTLKLLELTGARLELALDGPGRLVLEGVEPG